jgi:hypothetical protein
LALRANIGPGPTLHSFCVLRVICRQIRSALDLRIFAE